MTFTLKYANAENAVERFLELACLTYGHDHVDRHDEARRMLKEDPTLAERNIFTVCCIGKADLLKQKLASDDVDVNQTGGPMNWPPLLYACYSRVESEGGSTLQVARFLLEHGANPNAYFMWGGQYRFTALTGAFGEGESGPRQQSAHRNCEALTRLLLKAGADPNDSQALYNRMFTPGSRCLEILMEYGLNIGAKCNWLVNKDGQLFPNDTGTLAYQLQWAIEKHHNDRVKLILDSVPVFEKGSSPVKPQSQTTPCSRETVHSRSQITAGESQAPFSNSFIKLAILSGNVEARDMLLGKGAVSPGLTLSEQFTSAVAAGDADAARQLLSDNAAEAEELRAQLSEMLHTAAGANRSIVVNCALELGANVNSLRGATALHQAAWNGHLEMVKLLLDAGADPSIKDLSHNATPEDWGYYSGNSEVADYLSRVGSE